jgi:hypothetical protein
MYVVPKENASEQEEGESQCQNALLSGKGEVFERECGLFLCGICVRKKRVEVGLGERESQARPEGY